MEEGRIFGRLPSILRMGGYLIAAGALAGFSIGLYLVLNRELFSFLIRISPLETTGYFLVVFMPSFIILVVVGYLFATTFGLNKTDLPNVAPLSVLSLLSVVVATLSTFYIVSLVGGVLTLTALLVGYTKPTFKILSKREAFFLVETGHLFVASFSVLFLAMWLLSFFFQTYAMGFLGSYSPLALLLVGVLSFFMFLAVPLLGSKGTSAGLCGSLGLAVTLLSYLFAVQNGFVLFNTSSYIGMFLLVLGLVLALGGEILYVKLFFSEPTLPDVPASSLLFQGKFCPYCGKPRATAVQTVCSHCRRSLMWTPYSPFCSSCGRLAPVGVQACPHCREDIGSKLGIFQLTYSREQAIASKLLKESSKQKSWMAIELSKTGRVLQTTGRTFGKIIGVFNALLERLSLTLREAAFIMVMTYVIAFFGFIGHVRVVPIPVEPGGTFFEMSYGFPLEWFRVTTAFTYYVVDTAILWIPLVFDFILYFLFSLALVYGITRLRR